VRRSPIRFAPSVSSREDGLSIGYRFEAATRTVRIEISGVITEAELIEVARKLSTDPDLPPGHRELIDLTGVEQTDVSPAALRLVAGWFSGTDQVANRGRVAVCAPADLAFGLSRMYEVFRQPSGIHLRVFRTIEEARVWLAEGDA
jgi:hypothetical protein